MALAATPASPPATPARAPAIAGEAPPTAQEVRANTLPLVRARLRLPDSLQDFAVAEVAPTAQDSARFVIRVTFKARTPFGSVTAHEARFAMKRSASNTVREPGCNPRSRSHEAKAYAGCLILFK